MKYDTLIFDFFGVLCSNVAPNWFNNHFSEPQATDFKRKYSREADIGKISEAEFYKQLSVISSTSPDDVEKEMNSYVILNKELIQLVVELKKQYKIGLCSNAGSSFIRNILKENDIESLFDSIIISSEVGLVKPDLKIYIKAIESLEIKANEAIFIDDTLLNVQEAEKLGMKGIVFKSNDELKKELLQLQT